MINKRRVKIINYHDISSEHNPYISNLGITHSVRQFTSQLDFIRKNYRVIPLTDVQEAPAYSVALTFDDGYASVLQNVYPLILRERIPIALFLISDTLVEGNLTHRNEFSMEVEKAKMRKYKPESMGHGNDGGPCDAFDASASLQTKLYVNVEGVRQMLQSGYILLGSHTHRHLDLSCLTSDEAYEEIRRSLQILRDEFLVGSKLVLSLPFGSMPPDFSSLVPRLCSDGVSAVLLADNTLLKYCLNNGSIAVLDRIAIGSTEKKYKILVDIELKPLAYSLIKKRQRKFQYFNKLASSSQC